MIVVGGTYNESCDELGYDALYGSGMKAAASLAAVDPDVRFVTAVDAANRDMLDSTARALGVRDVVVVERSEAIGFHYATSVSKPYMYGADQPHVEIAEVTGDAVTVFGMVEAVPSVSGDRVVIDPQHSPTRWWRDRVQAKHLCLVMNAHEAMTMTGIAHVEGAAAELMETERCEAVVVKLGAHGALVAQPGSPAAYVDAHPTSEVFPIGSGDVFTAGFAWAWTQGADPVKAAGCGSWAASLWCGSRSLPIPNTILDAIPITRTDARRHPKVYLAGPFFDVGQRHVIDLLRVALRELGATPFSPLHEIGPGGPEVAIADLDALASCDGVLALLDGDDAGTVFEVGWATAKGIPVTGVAARPGPHSLTMIEGSGTAIRTDMASGVYQAIWQCRGRD